MQHCQDSKAVQTSAHSIDKEESPLESYLDAFSSHVNKIIREGVSDWKRKVGERRRAGRMWKRKEKGWDIARVQLQTASVSCGSGDKSQVLKFPIGHLAMVSHSIYWSLNFSSVNIICR